MLVTAIYQLKKLNERKSFSFLKQEIMLILVFATTVLINGLVLMRIEAFNFWRPGEKWYKVMFGIIVEYAAGLSLSWVFWSLTYTYWVSAQSLLFFQHHFDRQQDINELKKQITIR